MILERLKAAGDERSYSMPFASRIRQDDGFKDGHAVRDFQPLKMRETLWAPYKDI